MRLSPSLAPLGVALATLAIGCSLGLSPRPHAKDSAANEPARAEVAATPIPRAPDPPRDLPGVDTTSLQDARKQVFWDVANRLYAPCSEQAVTLVQCIEERRSCDACLPAANVLVDQVKRGVAKAQAAAAVNSRFSPDVVRKVTVGASPTRGSEDAPVTIIVFSDFQCPACGATVPLLDSLMEHHRNDVRLVHKFYPLKKHTRARPAAYAAVAAMKQGKYWEMEKIIFENQEALSDEDLERYAERIGLDIVRYRVDVSSPATQEVVDRDVEAGDTVGVAHTPYILINGRVFDPAYYKYDRDLEPWVAMEAQLVRNQHKEGAKKPEDAAAKMPLDK